MKLAWFNGGAEFRPQISIPEIDDYERAEAAWATRIREQVKTGTGATTQADLLRLQAAFVEKVLKRSANAKIDVELGAIEVREAFIGLWNSVFPKMNGHKPSEESEDESPFA